MQNSNITIRALGASDAEAYRVLRLTALAASPEAFGSSYEEEAELSLDGFRAHVVTSGRSVIFGAFADNHLAGFFASERVKKRHKGTLWGVFLMPEWRGRGLADRLIQRVVEHANEHVVVLQASVVATNQKARRAYARFGFVPYGIERHALCIDGMFYDSEHLALNLCEGRPAVA
jgi:RimJ/RimL family protein N-acetyltransferase